MTSPVTSKPGSSGGQVVQRATKTRPPWAETNIAESEKWKSSASANRRRVSLFVFFCRSLTLRRTGLVGVTAARGRPVGGRLSALAHSRRDPKGRESSPSPPVLGDRPQRREVQRRAPHRPRSLLRRRPRRPRRPRRRHVQPRGQFARPHLRRRLVAGVQ